MVAFDCDPKTMPEMNMMISKFKERRDLLLSMLKEIPGFKVNIPYGAFYVFPCLAPYGEDSMAFCTRLVAWAKVSSSTGT